MRFRVAGVLGLVAALMSTVALADAVGNAEDVDPAARAIYERVDGPLLVGADIFIGQQIITTELGQVEILFRDGTRLAIGPRSQMTIEDYLIRNNGSAGKFAIDALKGTFRFVTGSAPKDSYEIKTPTGTIGVRGTAFDFFVDENGHVVLLLYHGAATLCSVGGECTEVADRCDLGTMTEHDSALLGSSRKLTRPDIDAMRASLPFAVSQLGLQRPFWVDKARECLKTWGIKGPGKGKGQIFAGGEEGTGLPGEPVITPPPPPPPEESGDDCAGNSDHNPGNSQNCNGQGGGGPG